MSGGRDDEELRALREAHYVSTLLRTVGAKPKRKRKKKRKSKKKMPDVVLDDRGTVVIFNLLTTRAREWWAENVASEAWQYLSERRVTVSHSYAADIATAMRREGFRVR